MMPRVPTHMLSRRNRDFSRHAMGRQSQRNAVFQLKFQIWAIVHCGSDVLTGRLPVSEFSRSDRSARPRRQFKSGLKSSMATAILHETESEATNRMLRTFLMSREMFWNALPY